MRKISFAMVVLSFSMIAIGQETRIDISNFDENFDWQYTGAAVIQSFVMFPDEIAPVEAVVGENVLMVEYQYGDDYWSGDTWTPLNFPEGAIDLTGMREIHMWVYFDPATVGDLSVRVDIGGTALGAQTAPSAGEWHELVWKIDRLTSDGRLASIGNLGGFIAPGSNGAGGTLFVDNIFAVRPASIPDIKQELLYGFNEEDPDTFNPMGWQAASGETPLLGQGDVDPSEGSNYMEVIIGNAWVNNVQTSGAVDDFDRWPDVLEMMIDARIGPEFGGSWVQADLILQSGVTDGDGTEIVEDWDSYPPIGFAGVTDTWKTLLWEVDMSKHADAFIKEGGWFTINFATNNPSGFAGSLAYFDNFRVSLPVASVSVGEWSLH